MCLCLPLFLFMHIYVSARRQIHLYTCKTSGQATVYKIANMSLIFNRFLFAFIPMSDMITQTTVILLGVSIILCLLFFLVPLLKIEDCYIFTYLFLQGMRIKLYLQPEGSDIFIFVSTIKNDRCGNLYLLMLQAVNNCR